MHAQKIKRKKKEITQTLRTNFNSKQIYFLYVKKKRLHRVETNTSNHQESHLIYFGSIDPIVWYDCHNVNRFIYYWYILENMFFFITQINPAEIRG